jgi:hypothetical protein
MYFNCYLCSIMQLFINVLFLPGPLASQASGSIGGHNLSRSKGGPTMRAKPYSPQSRTASQKIAQQNLGSLSALWKGLTQTQRQGWIVGAQTFSNKNRFGIANTISGQSLFNKLNSNLLLCGLSPNSSIPVMVNPIAPVISGFTEPGGLPNFWIQFTPGTDAASYIVVYCTPLMSVGNSTYKNILRKIFAVSGSYANIQVDIASVYGQQPAVGHAVWVSAYCINASCGIASSDSIMQCIFF